MASITGESIARAVSAQKGGAPHKTSTGYECRCPAHDDHDPSLSIAESNGKILVHCHAGCSQESVISALTDMGLWEKSSSHPDPAPEIPRGISQKWAQGTKKLTHVYAYIDTSGEVQGYTARYEDGAGGKDVIPYFGRSTDGRAWFAKGQSGARTLYGLPSLKNPGPVYVVEGEKSADALIKQGRACVSSVGGCKAPHKSDWSPLAGRDAILWPDHDTPGVQYANTISQILKCIASSVERVDVDAMHPTCSGWDCADWDGVGEIPIKKHQQSPTAQSPMQLRLTKSGQIKPIMHNLCMMLEHVDALRGCVGTDTLADRPVWVRQPPFLREKRGAIHDQDAAEFACWAAEHFDADFASSSAFEAISTVAKRYPFHPVHDYLSKLHWDGIPRLNNWISDAFGVARNNYHSAVGRCFLISAVARVFEPGCKVDSMMVLMGSQGIGKTTAAKELSPVPAWYGETIETPGTKDFYQGLNGKWILEIGELHSFKNADWTKVKQMLSCSSDSYRASYGRMTTEHLRACVFIGTTNDLKWNRDHSGARRFLPVRCTEANIDFIRGQRDQLWAEAVILYKKGVSWWDIPANDEQDAVYESDAWEDKIDDWLIMNRPGTHRTGDILEKCLGIEPGRWTHGDQTRVGKALTRLGGEHIRVKVARKVFWAYKFE